MCHQVTGKETCFFFFWFRIFKGNGEKQKKIKMAPNPYALVNIFAGLLKGCVEIKADDFALINICHFVLVFLSQQCNWYLSMWISICVHHHFNIHIIFHYASHIYSLTNPLLIVPSFLPLWKNTMRNIFMICSHVFITFESIPWKSIMF